MEAAGVVAESAADKPVDRSLRLRHLAEQSEGLVEAAGVEPASENTSPSDPTCVFPFALSQPDENGTKSPGRPSRKISSLRSGRPAATSLLNDGRPPRRRQSQGDRSLVIKQRERSQYSQLANFHRIYEEMALGTRPTFQHPRRSQVAPKREVETEPDIYCSSRPKSPVTSPTCPAPPYQPYQPFKKPQSPAHSRPHSSHRRSARECARSRCRAALRW